MEDARVGAPDHALVAEERSRLAAMGVGDDDRRIVADPIAGAAECVVEDLVLLRYIGDRSEDFAALREKVDALLRLS